MGRKWTSGGCRALTTSRLLSTASSPTRHPAEADRPRARRKTRAHKALMRYRQAIALLALVGLFVALYLWLHALGYGGAIKCGASGGCEVVQTSPWAVFLGLPVAFYGVVGYLAILVVAIVALRPAALSQPRWSKWLVVLATVGFGFTLYLTYLELFVIHAICRWCIGSAVIITAIWIVSLLSLKSPAIRTDHATSPLQQGRQA